MVQAARAAAPSAAWVPGGISGARARHGSAQAVQQRLTGSCVQLVQALPRSREFDVGFI